MKSTPNREKLGKKEGAGKTAQSLQAPVGLQQDLGLVLAPTSDSSQSPNSSSRDLTPPASADTCIHVHTPRCRHTHLSIIWTNRKKSFKGREMGPTTIAKMPTRVRTGNIVNEHETPNRNQKLNLTMMPAAPRRIKDPCAERASPEQHQLEHREKALLVQANWKTPSP